MKMDIGGLVLRTRKGVKLTKEEMDENFIYLEGISKVELENIKQIIEEFKLSEDLNWNLIGDKIADILENDLNIESGLSDIKNILNDNDFNDDILENIILSKIDIIDFILEESNDIKNKIDNIKLDVDFSSLESKIDNIKLDVDLTGVENKLENIEGKIDIIRKNQKLITDTKVIIKEYKNPITEIKRQVEGIKVLGVDDIFKLSKGRLIGKSGEDLKNYLPVIFNYEPINGDLILVGIKDYKTKGDLIYLVYETIDKRTGVRKIFDAGLGIWDKYKEKIKLYYEFNIKTS
jgi:CRISPR/Cas system-associated exonuclease Cas4 (RecB family)